MSIEAKATEFVVMYQMHVNTPARQWRDCKPMPYDAAVAEAARLGQFILGYFFVKEAKADPR